MPELYQTEKVPMTEADRERMNAEHVKSQLELETLKEEKRDVSSVYRVKIRELEEKIHTLASQLDVGEFERRFEVTEEPDDSRLMVEVVRKENGQRVATRPMTEVEKEGVRKRKQVELFSDEDDGDTEPPPPNVRVLPNGIRGPKARTRKAKPRR